MNISQIKSPAKYGIMLSLLAVMLLFSAQMAYAGAEFVTDLTTWESMVTNIEVLVTNADNIALADEVDSAPGSNAKLGPVLTFQEENTPLSRGFSIESYQGGTDPNDFISYAGGFTYYDTESNLPIEWFDQYDEALSIGDIDDWTDDDWRLDLLDGATMTALGVEIRHARFADGESITLNLFSKDSPVATLDLGVLPDTGNETYFIGIVSDIPFDSIDFDEDSDGDDIAIADFRFAEIISADLIEAIVNIRPGIIQLKSRGRYVRASIELPDGYSVEDINIDSVAITGINGDMIDPPLYTVGRRHILDFNRDGIPTLHVKFDRQDLIELLEVTDETITISGELADGTRFSGTDKIRVIKCRKKNRINFSRHLKTWFVWNSR